MTNEFNAIGLTELIEGLSYHGALNILKTNIIPSRKIGTNYFTTSNALKLFIYKNPHIHLTKKGAEFIQHSQNDTCETI